MYRAYSLLRGNNGHLYDYALRYAKEIGCDTLTLNVWCGNDSAMAFYESRGLKPRNIHMEAKL